MSKYFEPVKEAKKIAIISHINPDADAICSSLALRRLIENNFDYKAVDVFLGGEIGSLYMPVLRSEGINPPPFKSYDLAIVLDCPNKNRTGEYEAIIEDAPVVINLDHHASNDKFGDMTFVMPTASSTCEIIFLLAKEQGLVFNNIIARQLYQGIITDTNCFTSLSITKKTHEVLSELLKYKFDPDAIKSYYFKNNSIAKTKLISKALLSMKFYCDEKFTTMKISHELMTKIGASFEDTLGIIDNGINISGTETSAILIEQQPGHIYVSLRSKGKVNVGEIAKEFNGGGSVKLAAFQIEGEIKEIEKQLVDEMTSRLSSITEDEIIIV